MPRRRKPPAPGASSPAPVIHPHAVYTRRQLCDLLGLPEETVRSEVRAGRLVPSRVARRYLFRGVRVLQWLRRREIVRPPRPPGV